MKKPAHPNPESLTLAAFTALIRDKDAVQWLHELELVLRDRVLEYTTPFFPCSESHTVFFGRMCHWNTWIVGSVALTVVSMPTEFPTPANVNAISAKCWYTSWLALMTSLHFIVVEDAACYDSYSAVASRRVTFEHPDKKTICITFASGPNIFELFVAGGNTTQTNAITGREVLCTNIETTSNFEGVRGWAVELQDADQNRKYIGLNQIFTPFPGVIKLYDDTEHWTRPCHWACPGRWRKLEGLQGIGHWRWGGIDESGGIDTTIAEMGRNFKAADPHLWSTDGSCYVDECGEFFHFYVFGQAKTGVEFVDAHRRFKVQIPPDVDAAVADAFNIQMYNLGEAVREDDDLDCDKSLDMDVRPCTDVGRKDFTGGTWIELHVDHVGFKRATFFYADTKGDLIPTVPLSCSDWPLKAGDWILAEATLHKRESLTFEYRQYELLARNVRVLTLDTIPDDNTLSDTSTAAHEDSGADEHSQIPGDIVAEDVHDSSDAAEPEKTTALPVSVPSPSAEETGIAAEERSVELGDGVKRRRSGSETEGGHT
ncbi:hypothetical protein C8R43DRAFT_1124824 [Mycena crocata]|nr:hypothetical protein C8R43DRAFT_1124824 [Mycena crocata]